MKTILCFGDSNTHGYEPRTGGRLGPAQRWPGVMAAALGGGYHIVEEGLPGRTTVFDDPITEGLCGLSLLTPLMMTHAPLDSMVVMLGTNDTKARFGVEAGMIGMGMRRLLEKALATPAWRELPDILVVSPAPILPGYEKQDLLGSFGPGADRKSAGLASVYAQHSKELGLRFFDAGLATAPDPADGIHLGTDGHKALGMALAKLFQE